MRHSATRSLLERRDVIIVASVSCIYGLGSPETYREMLLQLRSGMEIAREDVLRKLVEIQYQRNDDDFHRGTFRVRGDVLEIFPSHEEDRAVRVEFFGDEIDSIKEIDPLTGKRSASPGERRHLPRDPLRDDPDNLDRAVKAIQLELSQALEEFYRRGKLVEAQRLEERTRMDLEMLLELGYCTGSKTIQAISTGAGPASRPRP